MKKLKAHRKRVAKPAGDQSTHIRIESPPVLLASRSEELEPLHTDDFRIVRVGSSATSTFDGD